MISEFKQVLITSKEKNNAEKKMSFFPSLWNNHWIWQSNPGACWLSHQSDSWSKLIVNYSSTSFLPS